MNIKNKKGLSDVVSNVLIILIVVAAVAILGLIVVNLVKSAGGGVTAQAVCQTLNVQVTSCNRYGWTDPGATTATTDDVAKNGAIATFIRDSGDASIKINSVTFNFVKSDTTTEALLKTGTGLGTDSLLTIGESVTGNFTGVASPTTIDAVIPVVSGTDADGKPITCSITQARTPCN